MRKSEAAPPLAVSRIIEGFGLTLVVGSVRRVTGRVWRAEASVGSVAIKCFEDPRVAGVESGLLDHLQGGGRGLYRVQTLVRGEGGAPLVKIGGWSVMVTGWVEGSLRGYRDLDAEGWAVLGRSLGALHARLDSASQIVGLGALTDGLRALSLEAERARIARQKAALRGLGVSAGVLGCLADRLLLLDTHLEACQAGCPDSDFGPIHNDYNVHNFLFGDAGPPVILDWDRATCAPRAYEVVRCLNHLPIEAPALARSFVDAYLEVHPLDPEALVWAVHAALTRHAVKHWPVELMLAGAEGAERRLEAVAEMVNVLASGHEALRVFFEEIAQRL